MLESTEKKIPLITAVKNIQNMSWEGNYTEDILVFFVQRMNFVKFLYHTVLTWIIS